jgi:hypothetical protein
MGEPDFYNFTSPAQYARRLDPTETFSVEMRFPLLAAALPAAITLYRMRVSKDWWRRIRHRCLFCGTRRPKWQGNDVWLEHVFACKRVAK